MNAIGVRTRLRCSHCKIRSLNVRAYFEADVNLLGVFELQILHHQVIAFVECHSLQTSRKPLINFELNATVREIQAAESFQVLILK